MNYIEELDYLIDLLKNRHFDHPIDYHTQKEYLDRLLNLRREYSILSILNISESELSDIETIRKMKENIESGLLAPNPDEKM